MFTACCIFGSSQTSWFGYLTILYMERNLQSLRYLNFSRVICINCKDIRDSFEIHSHNLTLIFVDTCKKISCHLYKCIRAYYVVTLGLDATYTRRYMPIFEETYCLHIQCWSDGAGKWRDLYGQRLCPIRILQLCLAHSFNRFQIPPLLRSPLQPWRWIQYVYVRVCKASKPKRTTSPSSLPWEPQIS